MLEQEKEFENPFKSGFTESFGFDQSILDDYIKEQEAVRQNLLSNFFTINKNYQKLNETYNDVKKLANTYIDKTESNNKVSTLESKLSRYLT